MSDGSLSQDEIDALLQGTESIEMDQGGGGAASGISEGEAAAFSELLRGIAESQGSNLSMMMSKTVNLGDPTVSLKAPQEVAASEQGEVVDVRVDFSEGLVGEHSYFFSKQSASIIAGLMMGQQGNELDEAALSAVTEAVSQITGTTATALGNKVGRTIRMAPPDARKSEGAQLRLPKGEFCVVAEFPLNIEGFAPSRLSEVFSLALVKDILSMSGGGAEAAAPVSPGPASRAPAAQARPAAAQQAAAQPMGGMAGFQQTFGQAFGAPMGPTMNPPNVQPVQFANLQPAPSSAEQGNIGLLMDVYMEMTVELGRTKRPIKWILGIGEGTIIELDKLAGEPVDILVNHKLIAKGEVVVIDENFGVRVTEIVSQIDRMNELS